MENYNNHTEQSLREAKEAEDIARWIRAYEEHPQTEEEYGWVDYAALEVFKELARLEAEEDKPLE